MKIQTTYEDTIENITFYALANGYKPTTTKEKVVKVKDADGNQVYGQIAILDDEGQPVLDADGNPTFSQGAEKTEIKTITINHDVKEFVANLTKRNLVNIIAVPIREYVIEQTKAQGDAMANDEVAKLEGRLTVEVSEDV